MSVDEKPKQLIGEAPMERTWVYLRDVAPLFNMSYGGAKNANQRGTFPIKVRRLGQDLVCDKKAVLLYFQRFSDESVAQVERLCGVMTNASAG